MDRDDICLVGCGGGGDRLTDTIIDIDSRYQPIFINSAKTDLESLNNFDPQIKNYICTSINNGTGRNRQLGKKYASKNGMRILDMILKTDQKCVFLVFGLGGGTGGATAFTILQGINEMKKQGVFDKTINIIGILPDLLSPDIILKNTKETWNELMNFDCIDNMIFIDNNNLINSHYLSEDEINEKFAKLFDSIFDIPDMNGTKFDNGNLGNILTSKGCTYIYDLPSGHENVSQALKVADENSVLAKMYTNKDIIIKDEENKKQLIKCGYLGTSFNDEKYTNEEVLGKYKYSEENYYGYNDEKNLLIITGMLPPFYSIQVIEDELKDRAKTNNSNMTNFSKFTSDYENKESTIPKEKQRTTIPTQTRNKKIKKIMKKNLFDAL